jgi:hypothetical protein
MSTEDILNKIQNELTRRFPDYQGRRTTDYAINPARRSNDKGFPDVPYTGDDDDFETHIYVGEADKKDEDEEEGETTPKPIEPEPEPEKKEEIPAEGEEDIGGMEGIPGEEGIPGMEGIPGEEKEEEGPEDSIEVGKVYELKKIYARLVAIQTHLNTVSDEFLIDLRKHVNQSLDLFKTVISNFKLYKDRIDEIIETYYQFVDNVYSILSKFYKNKKD